MTVKILKPNEVDFTKISYLTPFIVDKDSIIPICYRSTKNEPFLVQIPSLLLSDKYQGKGELILPLVCKTDKETKMITDFFTKLDEILLNNIRILITKYKTSKYLS